jgi:hypothetical protein
LWHLYRRTGLCMHGPWIPRGATVPLSQQHRTQTMEQNASATLGCRICGDLHSLPLASCSSTPASGASKPATASSQPGGRCYRLASPLSSRPLVDFVLEHLPPDVHPADAAAQLHALETLQHSQEHQPEQLKQASASWDLRDIPGVISDLCSDCYCATVLLCYCATVLLCYCATVLLCYCATVLLCYCARPLCCTYESSSIAAPAAACPTNS